MKIVAVNLMRRALELVVKLLMPPARVLAPRLVQKKNSAGRR
jgi:hypothetical protein